MKKISFLFLMTLVFFACNTPTKDTDHATSESSKTEKMVEGKNRIEVLDFYGTHRCTTCKNIEANTRYTLNTAFKNEVDDGTIVFKTINFDDKKNEPIVTAYFAYGTSLFLNVVKDGKETHIDLSDFAFQKGDKKEVYSKLLTEKINKELKKL